MRVKDKEIGKEVDVFEKACVSDGRVCYWPRTHPGVFVQGRGYSGGTNDYICGTRQIRGCPEVVPYTWGD